MLYAWFFLMPTLVDQALWLEDPSAILAVAVAVYAVQYLALFGLLEGGSRLARVARDFLVSRRTVGWPGSA